MLSNKIIQVSLLFISVVALHVSSTGQIPKERENRIDNLLKEMSIEEKIGQLNLVNSPGNLGSRMLDIQVQTGLAGAILNECDPAMVRKYQQAAMEKSRLGIPLLFGRDVIHGFKTIMPVNIGLAATFNPELVEESARVAAREAYNHGIRWTFGPMADVARDPRWGRMAESFGEDPLLVARMSLAFHRGFVGSDPGHPFVATCAKHFAGYGAVEGGRDYNTVAIPEIDLRNIYLVPFHALVKDGVSSVMTSFTELNGVPASGNAFLIRKILKGEWGYQGMVVSDWASIPEMITHGYASDEKDAALKAFTAGVDMEMASATYYKHLLSLVKEGKISEGMIDDAVRRVLELKQKLGLFDDPYPELEAARTDVPDSHLETAREAAVQSLVLLRNEHGILPLKKDPGKVCVIGPMADDRYEQLGTWVFDADTNMTITPLAALEEHFGKDNIHYVKTLGYSRDESHDRFDAAVDAAASSDVVLFFAGEESILTGEAHSRAMLDLPGAQEELITELAGTGTPIVLVILAARPLSLMNIIPYTDAILYAWHPGTMGGPAIADVLTGARPPSGKLPVTFPKAPGQIPIYYAHKNTGRPASAESWTEMSDIPVRTPQTSLGNTSHYLDLGYEPLFPFGFGLSYTLFEYDDLQVSAGIIGMEDTLVVSAVITNAGSVEAEEVAQFYVRDVTASVTRPVKELKDFKRVTIAPGASQQVSFTLTRDDLAFYNSDMKMVTEPGLFEVWIGSSSDSGLKATFTLKKDVLNEL